MKLLFYIICSALLIICLLGTSCCSVYTSSSFSTDSAHVHNLKINKTDSIYFSPIKK